VARWSDTQLSNEEQFANVTKQGLPVATIQLKIVDPEDFTKTLPNDGKTAGELMSRGPHITAEYYNSPQPSKFLDGWMATGDVASITADGVMQIRDRSKDVIKSGGEWISSQDLEKHINGHPSIATAAVVAVAHPKWDERPVAVLVLKPGKTVTLKEVRDFMGTNFAKYELVDDVLIWDEMPMTGTGKISKKDIRERMTKEKYVLPSLRNPVPSKL
jgi:fatty-acyl-CoA synthase